MKHTILYLFVLSFFSCEQAAQTHEPNNSVQSNVLSIVTNETDPICDMSVKEHAADTALVDGKVWGFCSSACKEKYVNAKNPKR